jgi:hypothetical protein
MVTTLGCIGDLCRGGEIKEEWVAHGGRLSPDDHRIHYKIGLDNNVIEDGVREAVIAALDHWNAHREHSNIVLDFWPVVTKRTDVDLLISATTDTNESGICAKFQTAMIEGKPTTGVVYYHKVGYGSWVRGAEHAPVVMSHEIGHFLGLENARPKTTTIMSPGVVTVGDPNPCETFARKAKAQRPTLADALNAGKCVWKHHTPFLPKELAGTRRIGISAGLFFGLLSLVPITAQDTTTNVQPASESAPARQQRPLAWMPIPETARQVSGKYVVELTPGDEFVAEDLASLNSTNGLIVIAELLGKSSSFLSKDETTISTAYVAKVWEFIKGPDKKRPPNPWLINIILPGGKYLLEGGRTVEVRIRNRQPVALGERYLFFLDQVETPEPLRVFEDGKQTSYVPRFGSQGMFLIADSGVVKPRGHDVSPAFKQYMNKPQRKFVQMVKEAVQAPPSQQ